MEAFYGSRTARPQEHGQVGPKFPKGQVDTTLCSWRYPLIQFGELIKGLLVVKDEEDGNNYIMVKPDGA